MDFQVSKKPQNNITELPPEILLHVFTFLSVRNFTNFVNCTPTLFPYRDEESYWSTVTRRKFRVPKQPLLLEGRRWKWLYKKLLTQTQIYTWGNNERGNLGHVKPLVEPYGHLRPYPHTAGTGWPGRPWVDIYLGPVVEVQCGGWCTTILNSDGNIFIMGRLVGDGHGSAHGHHLRQLPFPPHKYTSSHVSYWPDTAIKQYSTGRSDVVGLSDSGLVWQWRYNNAAVLVTPLNIDFEAHKVIEVKAGWDRCAINVKDVGLAYWSAQHDSDLVPGRSQEVLQTGHELKVNMAIIPGTGDRSSNPSSDSIGEIREFVILEHHIVFTTHLSRVFSYKTTFPMPELDRPQPVELSTLYTASPDAQPFSIRSIAGNFRRLAILTTSGPIITTPSRFLPDYHSFSDPENLNATDPPQPTILPCLQTNTIISLAFGDHHLHALHIDGTITACGAEPQKCGALGLGNKPDHLGHDNERAFRGVIDASFSAGRIPFATVQKRTVWFEPLMRDWLRGLIHNLGVQGNFREGSTWDRITSSRRGRNGVGELRERYGDWFEREGRKWMGLEGVQRRLGITTASINQDEIPSGSPQPNEFSGEEDDLPPYFTLSIAAGGWHSAALVLVDEEAAERQRERMMERWMVRRNTFGGSALEWVGWAWDRAQMALLPYRLRPDRLLPSNNPTGRRRSGKEDWGELPDLG